MTFAYALTFVLCMGAQGQFTVEGHVKNAEGRKVILLYGDASGMKQDSTMVRNGRFVFKGNVGEVYGNAAVVFDRYDPYAPDSKVIRYYVEPSTTTTIDADYNRLADAVVTGGKVQSDANDYEALRAPVRARLEELNKAYYAAKTDVEREAVRKQLRPYGDFAEACTKFYIATRHDSYIAAEQMRFLMGQMKYEEIKSVYDAWTPEVRRCEAARAVKAELDVLAKVRPGSPAPDFTATDIGGKPFRLSSLKGKVVIIDFWASWCVPCRKSNPHMLELYKKYHDQGLDMVYVADDDRAEDKWKAAVEKDGLTGEGFHHVLRGLKVNPETHMPQSDGSDISSLYAVHFLPTKYLIDKQGNIVCRIEDESTLDAQIAELLKK